MLFFLGGCCWWNEGLGCFFLFFVCVLIFFWGGFRKFRPTKNPHDGPKASELLVLTIAFFLGGKGGFREIRWNPKKMGIESNHHLNSMRPQGMRVLPGARGPEHSTGSFKKRGRHEDFGHRGSWSFVMLGRWVLDRTPSQTLNPLKP